MKLQDVFELAHLASLFSSGCAFLHTAGQAIRPVSGNRCERWLFGYRRFAHRKSAVGSPGGLVPPLRSRRPPGVPVGGLVLAVASLVRDGASRQVCCLVFQREPCLGLLLVAGIFRVGALAGPRSAHWFQKSPEPHVLSAQRERSSPHLGRFVSAKPGRRVLQTPVSRPPLCYSRNL